MSCNTELLLHEGDMIGDKGGILKITRTSRFGLRPPGGSLEWALSPYAINPYSYARLGSEVLRTSAPEHQAL